MGIILIDGFTNAIRFNSDIFNRNSVPKGIGTVLRGKFHTKTALTALGESLDNLQRGIAATRLYLQFRLMRKATIEVLSLEKLRDISLPTPI